MSAPQRPLFLLRAMGLVAIFCATPASAQTATDVGSYDHQQGGGRVLTLPRDLEMRLAVNALPMPLRDGATVLVLESTGYTKAHQSSNAFTCLVSRRGGNLYPVCFDEEGTRTILTAFADDAVLRLKSTSDEEVERTIAKGFEEGRYRPPARPGIAYMLSPATYMRENGRLARSFPHTMFYAPFLTDSDIGRMESLGSWLSAPSPGRIILNGLWEATTPFMGALAGYPEIRRKLKVCSLIRRPILR